MDVALVIEKLRFEKHNNQALNFLKSFCQFGPYWNLEHHQYIVESLFRNREVTERIFRPFRFDDESQQVYVELKRG